MSYLQAITTVMILGVQVGCGVSTTVTTKAGNQLRGQLVDAGEESITLKVRVDDTTPVRLEGGGTTWVETTETRLVTFATEDVTAVKTQDRAALTVAIVGTSMMATGLVGLVPSLVWADTCDGLGCIGPHVAVPATATMALVGALMAAPAWGVWADSKREYEAPKSPKVQLGLGGVSGTF